MKLRRLIILFSLSIIILSPTYSNEKSDYDIPPKIETFLKQHFSKYKLEKLNYNNGECDVKYTNGYKIKFDKNNDWTEIESNNQPLPKTIIDLLPQNALLYISQNYSRKIILKIKREPYVYQVKFLEAPDLFFDKEGRFIRK